MWVINSLPLTNDVASDAENPDIVSFLDVNDWFLLKLYTGFVVKTNISSDFLKDISTPYSLQFSKGREYLRFLYQWDYFNH